MTDAVGHCSFCGATRGPFSKVEGCHGVDLHPLPEVRQAQRHPPRPVRPGPFRYDSRRCGRAGVAANWVGAEAAAIARSSRSCAAAGGCEQMARMYQSRPGWLERQPRRPRTVVQRRQRPTAMRCAPADRLCANPVAPETDVGAAKPRPCGERRCRGRTPQHACLANGLCPKECSTTSTRDSGGGVRSRRVKMLCTCASAVGAEERRSRGLLERPSAMRARTWRSVGEPWMGRGCVAATAGARPRVDDDPPVATRCTRRPPQHVGDAGLSR